MHLKNYARWTTSEKDFTWFGLVVKTRALAQSPFQMRALVNLWMNVFETIALSMVHTLTNLSQPTPTSYTSRTYHPIHRRFRLRCSSLRQICSWLWGKHLSHTLQHHRSSQVIKPHPIHRLCCAFETSMAPSNMVKDLLVFLYFPNDIFLRFKVRVRGDYL